jgi:outer membrane autotransporter protein
MASKLESDVVGETLSATLLEGGVYWRARFGGLIAAARGAVGYAGFESDRRFALGPLERVASAEWNGLTLTGNIGAAYEIPLGRFHLRPEASLDAFMLREGEYDENGGGAGFNLSVDERESRLVTGTAMVAFGARFGGGFQIRPEISAGWRQTLAGEVGDTTARFGAGTPFAIQAADAPEGAAILGFGLTGGTDLSTVSLQARAESGEDYTAADVRLNVRFRF